MKLKTHICKKTPANLNGDYALQIKPGNTSNTNGNGNKSNDKALDNLPLSCVDWSSNDEIYFVRYVSHLHGYSFVVPIIESKFLPQVMIIKYLSGVRQPGIR